VTRTHETAGWTSQFSDIILNTEGRVDELRKPVADRLKAHAMRVANALVCSTLILLQTRFKVGTIRRVSPLAIPQHRSSECCIWPQGPSRPTLHAATGEQIHFSCVAQLSFHKVEHSTSRRKHICSGPKNSRHTLIK
jgi:hypothetical protein